MTYKTILTVLTNPAEAELAISSAARLARKLDAHLDILALAVDRTQLGYSYLGTGAMLLEAGLEQADLEARRIDAAARVALKEESPDLRYSVETMVAQIGLTPELVGSRARFADLVVLPCPMAPALAPRLKPWSRPRCLTPMRRSWCCQPAAWAKTPCQSGSFWLGTKAPRRWSPRAAPCRC